MKLFLTQSKNLILRLLSILIIFQFCRLFFFLYNASYFNITSISEYLFIVYGSLRFDTSAILYLNIPLILLSLFPSIKTTMKWYRKTLSFLFITTNLIGILLNIFDAFYYQFSKNRFTISLLDEFANEQSPFKFLLEFLKYYWFMIPIIYLIFLSLKIISKQTETVVSSYNLNYRNLIFSSLLFILSLTLTVFGLRGSFIYKNRPITISNAAKYAKNPNEISIIINTPFSIFRTLKYSDLKQKEYFSESIIEDVMPVIKKGNKPLEMNKKNVVVIIMESMATEYYGFYNDYKGYTPFLDSLLKESYTSYLSYSNGSKSIDAIPSILASIPAETKFHFALSKYCTNNIQGIGNLLEKQGYTASFFHGAPNGSMGFESITKLCGIENYYGMNEYANKKDFDGLWGIWDHKFLSYYAKSLNTFTEPFFSSIFTLSSHHPFIIPKEFKNKFKKGKNPMYKCVQYTDYSLKLFFNNIKKQEWYNNTLFVITADHTNTSSNKEYKTSNGIFKVPIVFFDPNNDTLKGISSKVFQHIDILPSILSYLNFPNEHISFGKNIFKKETELTYAINYHNGYQLISPNTFIKYNEDKEKIIEVYNLKEDKLLENNIVNDSDSIKYLENKLMGFIQQYNNRMINNKLTFEN